MVGGKIAHEGEAFVEELAERHSGGAPVVGAGGVEEGPGGAEVVMLRVLVVRSRGEVTG
jgi:hypothetical protein